MRNARALDLNQLKITAPMMKRDSRNNRYFSRSIIKWEAWRKGARLVCREKSFIQKNHPERSIMQKFSCKNINNCWICVCIVNFQDKMYFWLQLKVRVNQIIITYNFRKLKKKIAYKRLNRTHYAESYLYFHSF